MTGCDVVTIGETMVLFQTPSDGPFLYAPLFTRSIAGAESNLAIALCRLGRTVRWISRLGNDPFGDIIAATLAGEGVDTSFVTRDSTAPTAIFFRETKGYIDPHVYYYRKHSAASQLAAADVQPEWFQGARHLHVTGITPALSENCCEVVTVAMRMAREAGLTVSFDPNLRRKLWDDATARRVLLSLVPLCDVFLPGQEEAEFLLGPLLLEEYATTFLDMGLRLVVLKRGGAGSVGFTSQFSVEAPPYQIHRIVDPIGAGDAFAAGLLSVLLEETGQAAGGWSVSEPVLTRALDRANTIGALATQFRGDWEGLPNLAELEMIQSGRRQITR